VDQYLQLIEEKEVQNSDNEASSRSHSNHTPSKHSDHHSEKDNEDESVNDFSVKDEGNPAGLIEVDSTARPTSDDYVSVASTQSNVRRFSNNEVPSSSPISIITRLHSPSNHPLTPPSTAVPYSHPSTPPSFVYFDQVTAVNSAMRVNQRKIPAEEDNSKVIRIGEQSKPSGSAASSENRFAHGEGRKLLNNEDASSASGESVYSTFSVPGTTTEVAPNSKFQQTLDNARLTLSAVIFHKLHVFL
jgi:hypothetical protein